MGEDEVRDRLAASLDENDTAGSRVAGAEERVASELSATAAGWRQQPPHRAAGGARRSRW
jgi:hypothetical protein